ncbi:MAG: hypothetical protein J5761_03210 [Paludibacteraceae bacterium]|nr:hypothetical protein [Paludibacteraceae bacterium]
MEEESINQEQVIDPWEGMEEWEAEGFESKEEYDDYCAKSAEDPLYGWGDLLTMKELRELLKTEEYKPSGKEAQYPDHLLLDEKTGMYYTDFFRDFRTHPILGRILAVECMECENLDWERVTGGYSPYIISRFQIMCEKPLCHENDKIVEKWGEGPYPGETFVDFFNWDEDRAIWFADNLPTTSYLILDEINFIKKYFSQYGLELMEQGKLIRESSIQWDILTTDYMDVLTKTADDDDPYNFKVKVKTWNKHKCLDNFSIIKEKRGVEVVRKIVELFRYDWRRIAAFNEFNLVEYSKEQKEDFQYFLFEGMDYYLDEWSKKTNQKIEVPQPVKKPQLTFEEVFSMHFRRSPEYERLLHFLEVERKEASDGDWARYALALFQAKIFIHSPKTFKSWLPRFCELFGRSVPYQDPNKLKRTRCERSIEAYLPLS